MSSRTWTSRARVLVTFGILSSSWSFAQETVKPFLRKAADQDAAYYLLMPYRNSGYLGANVSVKDAGPSTVFEVQPGPLYHLKQIQVLGLNAFPVEKLMEGAPKVGEVFSQVKMNDWIVAIRKKYAGQDGQLKFSKCRFLYDHARAEVSAKLIFEDRTNVRPESAPDGGQ